MGTALIITGVALLGLLGLVAAYLVLSVRIIGPTETGIVVKLGKPVAVRGSGICFYLRGVYKIVIYPTQMYNIIIPETDVITQKGTFKGEEYAAAMLQVSAAMYFRWPQGIGLIESYRTAPPPDLADVLKDHFEEAVQGLMREEGAEITWLQFIENRRAIAKKITETLRDNDMSPFHLAKITDLFLVMRGVILPKELQDALSLPQIEALRRHGIEQDARAERAFIEAQGQAYRHLGAWGPLAAIFALFGQRKTSSTQPSKEGKKEAK
jgi:regulator of protease activity HflC (stomatin/prohibitin superfamily)